MTIVLFDDWRSWGHMLYGLASVLLGVEVASAIVFAVYQYKEREKWRYKAGDYVEFSIGLVLGGVARQLLAWWGAAP